MASQAVVPKVDEQRRRRAGNPKTKSGCVTCKIRRVKCDESKPSCQKCLRLGQICPGYPGATTYNRPLILAPKVKLHQQIPISSTPFQEEPPDSLTDFQVVKTSRWQIPENDPLMIISPSAFQKFENNQAYWYFRIFCEETSVRLGGLFEKRLWTYVVHQDCNREPIIRDAAIAIGALDVALTARSSRENSMHNKHHFFALKQYGRALKGIRRLIAKNDYRGTMIASLLCIAFSSYNGDIDAAINHAASSLNLGKTWSSNNVVLKTPDRLDLRSTFVQLDIENISIAHMEPVIMDPVLENEVEMIFQQMPIEFPDLYMANSYWELITRCWFIACHRVKFMDRKVRDMESNDILDDQTIDSKEQQTLDVRLLYCGQLLETWSIAFQPLRARCHTEHFNVEAADLLELRHRAGQIYNNYIMWNALYIDEKYEEFEGILTIAKPLVENQRGKVCFSFNHPLIRCLYHIGLACPYPALRKETITLLRSVPWRAGIWDSLATAKALEVVMDLEGFGELDGFVPKSTRLRDSQAKFDLQQRRGYVEFRKGDDLMLKKVHFAW